MYRITNLKVTTGKISETLLYNKPPKTETFVKDLEAFRDKKTAFFFDVFELLLTKEIIILKDDRGVILKDDKGQDLTKEITNILVIIDSVEVEVEDVDEDCESCLHDAGDAYTKECSVCWNFDQYVANS